MSDGAELQYVNIARMCVSLIGFGLILSYKFAHAVRVRRSSSALTGKHRTLRTVASFALSAWRSPPQGAWIIGHMCCMLSSFAGSLYIFAMLCTKPWIFGRSSDPGWKRLCYGFRSIGAFVIVPLCVIQLALMAFGKYAPHRHLGRILVHGFTWTSVLQLVVSADDYVAFATCTTLLAIETTVYFGLKYLWPSARPEAGDKVAPAMTLDSPSSAATVNVKAGASFDGNAAAQPDHSQSTSRADDGASLRSSSKSSGGEAAVAGSSGSAGAVAGTPQATGTTAGDGPGGPPGPAPRAVGADADDLELATANALAATNFDG